MGNLCIFQAKLSERLGYPGALSSLADLASSPAAVHGAILVCCAAKWRRSRANRLPGAARPRSLQSDADTVDESTPKKGEE